MLTAIEAPKNKEVRVAAPTSFQSTIKSKSTKKNIGNQPLNNVNSMHRKKTAASQLLWLGRIKGKNGILEAFKHNKRTLQTERGSGANIDATRTSLNYSLVNNDKPEDLARHAKMQMMKAGVFPPRKNQVMAVEILFSLPVNRHQEDTRQFFTDCFEWVKSTFEGEILGFDVHLDESAPHAHAIILPLINNRMQGSDMIGSKGNLHRLNNLFHASVGCNYGLSLSNKNQLSFSGKDNLAKQVITNLKNDPVMQSSVWPCVRNAVYNDPLPYAQILSIQLSSNSRTKKIKSFVDHKRSPGRGSFIR